MPIKDTTSKAVRDLFERHTYDEYLKARVAQLLTSRGVTDEEISREAYFKLSPTGDYINEAVAMLWIGWKLSLEAHLKTFEDMFADAQKWQLWAQMQDKVLETLPPGYSLSLVMQSQIDGGFFVDCRDPEDNEVEYDGDVSSVGEDGAFFWDILDAALASARAHSAGKMS